MTRTLVISTLAIALVGACTGNPEDALQLEDEGGKTDVVRPYGTFKRTLAQDDAGFTLLRLNEDRTYDASQELVRCEPGECTDAFSGKFRFASSNAKPYVVLYDADGDWVYSFEYKLNADELSLRYTGTSSWFTMTKAADGLALDEGDNNGTFEVPEGDDVTLRLPANPSTGYTWNVTSTDRSFGYPQESFESDSDATGSGGTSVFTWKTSGALPLVGSHAVKLEYRRSWDTTSPPADTFAFTVNIVAP